MSFLKKLFTSFTKAERKTLVMCIIVGIACVVTAIVFIVFHTTK